MFDELRGLDGEHLQQAKVYIDHATTLSELLFGAEEGKLVRRRAAAAIADHSGQPLVA